MSETPVRRDAARLADVRSSTRRSTNLSLPAQLVAEARSLGVNVSQAAELGIAAAVASKRQQHWIDENLEALQSSNCFADQQGLPLARYQAF